MQIRRLDAAGGVVVRSPSETARGEFGIYDLDRKLISVVGPIHVAGPNDYDLQTRDVTVDLGSRQIRSAGPVSGRIELGQFQAGRMAADLDQRTVRLDGGVRLKIEQGAVR